MPGHHTKSTTKSSTSSTKKHSSHSKDDPYTHLTTDELEAKLKKLKAENAAHDAKIKAGRDRHGIDDNQWKDMLAKGPDPNLAHLSNDDIRERIKSLNKQNAQHDKNIAELSSDPEVVARANKRFREMGRSDLEI